jgi:hypothetical protein
VPLISPSLFHVFVSKVRDGILGTNKGIEEADEEIFVLLGAEQLLEAVIDKWV